ncbi:MAG: response regulator [Bacteroidales bacterium]
MFATKIFFCDNDFLSRKTIKILLDKIQNTDILGEFDKTEELILQLKLQTPDIVIYNLQSNKLNDIIRIKDILKRNPNVKVIITSTYEDIKTIAVAFSLGAIAFLPKRSLSVSNLSNAINYSKKNNHYLSRGSLYKMEDLNKMIQLNYSN